jgi:cytochrome c553
MTLSFLGALYRRFRSEYRTKAFALSAVASSTGWLRTIIGSKLRRRVLQALLRHSFKQSQLSLRRFGRTLSSRMTDICFVAQNRVKAGDAKAGRQKAESMSAVRHCVVGLAKIQEAPNLAGQNEGYPIAQLQAIKAGDRKNEMMSARARIFRRPLSKILRRTLRGSKFRGQDAHSIGARDRRTQSAI